LTNLDSKRTVRYVVSEELTGEETAQILGIAIGKPNLKWEIVSDEAIASSLKSIGMNPEIAKGLAEMYAALQSGHLAEDYIKNKPKIMGEVKLRDFAEEFNTVYENNR
ncbi:MAG: NAD-dependent dehydratase, partial [Maribacter arcticus]